MLKHFFVKLELLFRFLRTIEVLQWQARKPSSHKMRRRSINVSFTFLHQQHDKHNTRGHHQHATIIKHGEILEGPARNMRDTQTCRGACQKRALPQTSTVCGHVASQVGAAGKESQESQALMAQARKGEISTVVVQKRQNCFDQSRDSNRDFTETSWI